MDQRTKNALWITAGVVFVVALVAHHNITQQEIIIFCVVVPSIILHEVSHGYVANLFGDDTAKRAGRLTLNPVAHVDPVGTLIVPALMALSGIGVFGWAKPVPVNVGRLRSPRNQGVLVSLAGPIVNAAPGRRVRGRLRRSSPARAPTELGLRVAMVDLGPGDLLREPGQRGAVRVQHDSRSAARRIGAVRAPPAGTLVADLPQVPAVHHADPAGPRRAQLLVPPAARSPGSSSASTAGGRGSWGSELAGQSRAGARWRRRPGRRSPTATSWARAAPRDSTSWT